MILKIFIEEITKLKQQSIIKTVINESMDDESFLTPLFFCFPNLDLAKMFIKVGADANFLNFLVCYMNYQNNEEYLKFIVEQGKLNTDLMNSDNKTALILAYEADRLDLMKLLIDLGCNVNIFGCYPNKRTLLHNTCLIGDYQTTSFLIKHGADLDVRDDRLKTPRDLIKIPYQGKSDKQINELDQLCYKLTLKRVIN